MAVGKPGQPATTGTAVAVWCVVVVEPNVVVSKTSPNQCACINPVVAVAMCRSIAARLGWRAKAARVSGVAGEQPIHRVAERGQLGPPNVSLYADVAEQPELNSDVSGGSVVAVNAQAENQQPVGEKRSRASLVVCAVRGNGPKSTVPRIGCGSGVGHSRSCRNEPVRSAANCAVWSRSLARRC